MGNAAETSREELGPGDLGMAAGNGDLQRELAEGVDGGSQKPEDEPEVFEESEAFVEAVDTPRLLPPDSPVCVFGEAVDTPRLLLPDSPVAEAGRVNWAPPEPEEPVEFIDLHVDDKNPQQKQEEIVGFQKLSDSTDAILHDDQKPDEPQTIFSEKFDGGVEEEEEEVVLSEEFDASTDVKHVDQNVEEQIAVVSEKVAATCDELDHAREEEDEEQPVLLKSDSAISDSEARDGLGEVTNGSAAIVDDMESTVGDANEVIARKKSENEVLARVEIDGSDDSLHAGPKNGEPLEVPTDKFVVDNDTESNEQIAHQCGKQQMKDIPVQSVALSEEQAKLQQLKENNAELDNGFTATNGHASVRKEEGGFATNGHASVEKEDGTSATNEHATVENEDGSSCFHVTNATNDCLKEDIANMHTTTEQLQKESIESLGHLSSTISDNNKSSAPLALPSTSNPENLRGPGLSSRPAGLGSSAPLLETSARSVQQLQKESIEILGHSSSTSSDNNKSSAPSALPSTSNPENLRGPGLSSRPVGLGSSGPLLETSARSVQQPRANGSATLRVQQPSGETNNGDVEENDETHEKLQMIRVKFLRLAHRLGQTPHNVVVAQVLYRLGLAEQLKRNMNRPGVFSFDRASVVAEQLEAAGQETLDFSCTIMVIGKTGVGKSATINSIFDEVKLPTDAFQLGTKKVQEVVGMVQGIKVRVIDTPGLVSSFSDQHRNEKILHSVKRFINKIPPDIVLYFDRLDMQSRDYGDAPLLQTITDIFGASIWFNAIIVLTHAASAPPDGPNGNPLSYEMFVTQRSHVVQQAIRQAAGDVRLMNPVSLVENHSACRMNRAGQRVLPNGQVWKPQLLLLSFSSKILAEANMLLKLQDSPPGKAFGSRPRVPPLPFLLSSLLQSRPQLKLPDEQFGGDDNLDEDLDATSDSDEGSDYDELPPFKPLAKSQLAKLSKAQKKAYYEELDYREKLFYKKQLKEERRRRKFAKKMADMSKDMPDEHNNGDVEEETSGPSSVPVPMPDFVLPNSFDSDNPTHRYRFLDSSNQWLVRPVLDSQGWDHDIGYEGLNVERAFVIKDKIPLSVSGQLTKDKKECTLQMELASSIKHSESKATSLGLDMQTVGKDLAYTLRGETRFRNFRCNNTAAGISVTVLGDSMSAGLKFEDKMIISSRFKVLMSGGAMTGRGDIACGGRLEATLRDKDYPIGRALSTLALSIVDWHGDLALGCNIQSQFPVGRGTNLIGHANLSNKGTGQIGIRLNSSEHLQIALLALVPILSNVKRIVFGTSQSTM